MRIRIVAVGKLKEPHYRDAVDEYLARLRRYATIEEREIRDGTSAVVAAAIAKSIAPRSHVIALAIDGKQRNSEEFAAHLDALIERAVDIVFVIGGADGIPPGALTGSTERLSMSSMTLPHRLARLVLVEQLYRAMTIRRGEPYHH